MSQHGQRKQAGSRRQPSRVAVPTLAVLLSLALAALAWPRLQAAVLYLPVDTAIDRYFETRELPVAQLDALAGRARDAIAAHPHHRYFEGLSLIEYLRAMDRSRPGAARADALNASIEAAEQSLLRAPAQPRTWLRIASARAALREDRESVTTPLELSILSGRVEPPLMLPRLELGLRYLDGLAPESVSLLRDQAVLAWRLNERAFLQSLREERLEWTALRGLLGSGAGDVLAEMEARL